MTATAADVARFTNDGVLLSTSSDASGAIRNLRPDARDGSTSEIEMFTDNPADGQALLDEKFALLSQANPPHVGVEVIDDIGFGEEIPIAPSVPCFLLVDESRNQSTVARTRAYAHDTGLDRFALEMLA